MEDVQFEKIGAIMFYAKDNELVGSVGIEADQCNDAGVENAAKVALMDVFSVEEVERIAYFKLEQHYLIIPNTGLV